MQDVYASMLLADSSGTTLQNMNLTTLKALIQNEIESSKSAIKLEMYPVGSIYASKENIDPGTFIGGTWKRISQGRVLMGEGTLGTNTYTAGTEVAVGLPNITGTILSFYNWRKVNGNPYFSGAFREGGITDNKVINNSSNSEYYIGMDATFDASRSNSIYNNTITTVQPPAYVVYMWERIE